MRVNIYTKTSFKGMKVQDGVGIYVLSCVVGRQEITKSERLDLQSLTPNAAELKIVVEALKRFSKKSEIHIFTDSSYVTGYVQRLPEWKARNFRKSKGEEVANIELWKELERLLRGHQVTWELMQPHEYRKWLSSEVAKP